VGGWFPAITLSQPNYSMVVLLLGLWLLLGSDKKRKIKMAATW